MAEDLDFVPMPDNVVTAIQKVWTAEIKDASGKPLFTASPLIAARWRRRHTAPSLPSCLN